MSKDIRVPTLGESVTEATIAKWFKKEGDAVKMDEPLVELETDKVTVEVPAPASGKLEKINAEAGATIAVGALLGSIAEGAAGAAPSAPPPATSKAPPPPPPPPATAALAEHTLSPAVRKGVVENNLNPADIQGTGKDGRITKGDVIAATEAKSGSFAVSVPEMQVKAPAAPTAPAATQGGEERVKMTRLRATIAKRLKDAQNTAAMLTTFNEVDMSAVMGLRNQYKDVFEKKHGVKLGFMSFFVKAAIQALRDVPAVNAEIDGDDIVYKNFYNIGVAVGTDKGLVVPVVKNADMLSLAGIEKTIAGYGKQARDGKLQIADMQGGTFTITNGGIYGSLMSTPILNAPQSGILGMHAIKERPIAVNGQVVIRPMMYLALSYDHRIVDGKEAVTFLVRIKEGLEDPQRALLDL